MPQFDFYSFSYQVFLILPFYLFFYFLYLKFFLIDSSFVLKIRSKLENIKFNFSKKNLNSSKEDFIKIFF